LQVLILAVDDLRAMVPLLGNILTALESLNMHRLFRIHIYIFGDENSVAPSPTKKLGGGKIPPTVIIPFQLRDSLVGFHMQFIYDHLLALSIRLEQSLWT
jgi:hypothetical protein